MKKTKLDVHTITDKEWKEILSGKTSLLGLPNLPPNDKLALTYEQILMAEKIIPNFRKRYIKEYSK
jgi:hypothetical protein